MAYTAEQLQALIDLRASGELRVTVDGRTVQYQSGADLDRAIEQARRDVAAAQSGTYRGTTRYYEHGRGY